MNLHLILSDQLHSTISSLKDFRKGKDKILMCELNEQITHIKHHKKKIVFILSAMRHFGEALKKQGFDLDYIHFNDPHNSGTLQGEIQRAIKRHNPRKIIVTEPSEYHVLRHLKHSQQTHATPIEIRGDDRFLCTHDEFNDWANGKKQLRMEYFYRNMRKKYNILIDNGKPTGGAWNYDSENRNFPKTGLTIPKPHFTLPDKTTKALISEVNQHFGHHFGETDQFHFAVTRPQAVKVLKQFIEQKLSHFGDFQDAMLKDEAWMFHSHIGLYLNAGLLLPLECVKAVETAYSQGRAPLNAVEGFIRQIIGWREFVRGIYWLYMPDYETQNFLQTKRKLPAFYWDANTSMNCLKQCITETKQNAYAHHIQRLMVIGNFSLIAGITPKEVNEWYSIVYADAYQWVELPNVSGMVLFADGGRLASKPYAASGAYINKMSDYCKGCHYKVSKKQGSEACPFNYLYWDFLIRNQDKLDTNPRLRMAYKTLEKMSEDKRDMIKSDSKIFLNAMSKNRHV